MNKMKLKIKMMSKMKMIFKNKTKLKKIKKSQNGNKSMILEIFKINF